MSDKERDLANRAELVERLAKAIPKDGVEESMPGIKLARASEPTDRVNGVTKPSLCMIAQGAKEVTLGDSVYRYDSQHYMIATVDIPVTGRVVEASRSLPYLSIRLDLDPTMVGSIMVESGMSSPNNHSDARAMYVSPLDSDLLDAIVRLMRLFGTPYEARVLMPMVRREIIFRLLMGSQGDRLRHLPMLGGHTNRIAQAAERLRKNFDKPLSIEGLAKELGMSSSGFHHHFKTVMDMSPLQFQKVIRLQEARNLMLGDNLDASSAGYRVGYDDPSHFSRDYKKHFGNSPLRDVERLRSMAVAD
jgi:AraC-like DNA-binding protein